MKKLNCDFTSLDFYTLLSCHGRYLRLINVTKRQEGILRNMITKVHRKKARSSTSFSSSIFYEEPLPPHLTYQLSHGR